jgi:penicillin-binding protein 2
MIGNRKGEQMKKKKKEFNRYIAVLLIMMFVFAAIVSRLVFLQIVKAEEYTEKANTKAITEIQENAPRGKILDSNGDAFATNVQSYNLTFAETEDSNKYFFDTMDSIFKILDDNKETQKDDFALKVNPYRFEFKTDDEDARKTLEIRFKRDRGLNEKVQRALYPNKKEKLTEDEEETINEKLLEISPEDTFKFLVDQYKVSLEGIFEKIISQYKVVPEETLQRLSARYKGEVDDEIRNLLNEYSKASKKEEKDVLFKKLLEKYKVESTKLPEEKQLELERRYILVKDALKMQSFSGYKPIVIASNIKKETAYILYQKLNDLSGIDISMQPMRVYPFGQLGSAIIGYISKIGSNFDKYEEKGYDVNTDYIGIQGIEGSFEDRLKGTKGGKIVKLNRQGRAIEELGSRDPYPGQTIQLTLDKNVQYAAEVALDKTMLELQKKGRVKDVNMANATRGAAVAVDVKNGAILALASRPGFNPNDFSDPKGLSTDIFNKYFNPNYEAYGKLRGLNSSMIEKLFPVNEKTQKRYDRYDYVPKTLYNYATYSLVPPGSTFKPMTAIAGLESGAVRASDRVNDNGKFIGIDGKTVEFAVGGYGSVDLKKALSVSSNPYFMTVGDRLLKLSGYKNYDILAEYAWKFGLGEKPTENAKYSTGIEIGENFGQVFNSVSNKNNYAANYLLSTMEALKSGRGKFGAVFNPIDLYDNDGDTQKVKDIKSEFKNKIKEFIRSGGTESAVVKTYKDYLTSLISADAKYKGKNISTNEIAAVAYDMFRFTVENGYNESKLPFNMYNAAIGQGMSNFTPLQLANFVATIVNGGDRYKLHLVDKILDADGNIIQQIKPEVLEKTGIKSSTVESVKEGMQAVTSGEDGTARLAFTGFPIQTGGKTGSATALPNQDEIGRTSYGVYIGFAPYDNPRIAVAVLIFDGGHGGYIAPVARAMYEAYFKAELDAQGYTPINDVVAKPIQ